MEVNLSKKSMTFKNKKKLEGNKDKEAGFVGRRIRLRFFCLVVRDETLSVVIVSTENNERTTIHDFTGPKIVSSRGKETNKEQKTGFCGWLLSTKHSFFILSKNTIASINVNRK
jgi:hypothetical protein